VAASAAFQIALAAGQLKNYYWLSPYLWGISGTSLVVWFVLNFKRLFVGESGKQSAPSPVPRTGDVKVGDTKTGDIHFAPIIQVGHNPPPPPVVPQQAKPVLPKPIQKQSNVKFLSARKVNLVSDRGSGYAKYMEVPKKSHYEGIIACFRNEGIYGTPVKQFDDVIAYVRFFDDAGNEIGRGVKGACWLGEQFASVDIKTDDTECVVVLLLAGDSIIAPWKEKRPISIGSYTIDDHMWDSELPQMPAKIQVRLMDKYGELLLAPVDIEIKDVK
jgi:hypothetical protein